ncbi:MAG: hypothetical protein AAGA48_13220 [Myxococcota bacterium]
MSFELRSWIGLALATWLGSSIGWAQPAPSAPETEPETQDVSTPTDPDLVRHRCRLFPTAIDATVDTWDRSTELGRWVLEQQQQGWQVDDIELTVGRKTTGFLQAYAQVCLVPRQAGR